MAGIQDKINIAWLFRRSYELRKIYGGIVNWLRLIGVWLRLKNIFKKLRTNWRGRFKYVYLKPNRLVNLIRVHINRFVWKFNLSIRWFLNLKIVIIRWKIRYSLSRSIKNLTALV